MSKKQGNGDASLLIGLVLGLAIGAAVAVILAEVSREGNTHEVYERSKLATAKMRLEGAAEAASPPNS